jgi:hypothetical protein
MDLTLPTLLTLVNLDILLWIYILSSLGLLTFFNIGELARETGLVSLILQLSGRSWLETALVSSVLFFAIGMMAMITNMQDGAGVYISVNVAIIGFVYGAILAGFGFCIYRKDERIKYVLNLKQFSICLVIVALLIVEAMNGSGTPLYKFFSPTAILLYSSLFILSLGMASHNNPKPKIMIFNEANLTASLGGMGLGLVLWFVNGGEYLDSKGAIFLISNILFFGCTNYLIIYFYSLYKQTDVELNFKTKTWHIAEAAAFFIFLVYAPVGATEYYRESSDQTLLQRQHEAQQLRIEQLEAQIKLLTEKVGEV